MGKLYKLLLVEDDADWLDLYYEYLRSEEYEMDTARTISQAFSLLEHNDYDAVVTDLKMIGFGNEFGGFNVLEKVKESNPTTQVVVITAYGTQEIAFRATQRGAFDIVYKPPEPERLRVTIRGAIQAKAILSERQTTPRKDSPTELKDSPPQRPMTLFGILGNSRMMRQAFEKISYATHVDQPVLIFGEKGTGKSYIAKTIHANSVRKNRPFSRLDFSDLSTHWDSINNNIRRLSGGTFFVDNLSSLGEKEGSLLDNLLTLTEKGNVRLIAALTTGVSDITKLVQSATLPSVTLNKLMSISIFMPPLRYRKDGDDIPALIGHFLHLKSTDSRIEKQITVSANAMKKLVDHDYKNRNVVELYEIMERALNLAGSEDEIFEEHILFEREVSAGPMSDKPLYVFVSYTKEDSVFIDQLQKALEVNGITIWRDRDQLYPGMRWKSAIRKAVKDGGFFVACFSKAGENRSRTYMNEELNLAIEELRLRPKDRAWFIPVKLNECEIPDWEIGGGETFSDIQYLELFTNWEKSIATLVSVIKKANQISD